MKNQDKRPVVYVPRKITYYDDNNQEMVAGYYVSKAYLNFVGKTYNKDGTISKEYMVDFVNGLECLDKKDEMFEDFYTESDVNVRKVYVTQSYSKCRQYVNEQNYKLLNWPGAIADSRRKQQEIYKRVINYAYELEKKFVSCKEREHIDEIAKEV